MNKNNITRKINSDLPSRCLFFSGRAGTKQTPLRQSGDLRRYIYSSIFWVQVDKIWGLSGEKNY